MKHCICGYEQLHAIYTGIQFKALIITDTGRTRYGVGDLYECPSCGRLVMGGAVLNPTNHPVPEKFDIEFSTHDLFHWDNFSKPRYIKMYVEGATMPNKTFWYFQEYLTDDNKSQFQYASFPGLTIYHWKGLEG